MKISFLTEMGFEGKVSLTHLNMRTEFAWMIALDSYHYNIYDYNRVKGYDGVFVIIPKGDFYLNAVGCKLIDKINSISDLLKSNFTEVLKNNNKKIFFIQEGSVNLFNDWSVEDQFCYYNHLQNFDILFAHNNNDTKYYEGMFPNKEISVIPTLMITHLIENIKWNPQNKIMIGGNFSRFYGGFQSYILANKFSDYEKWTMTSHSKRDDEELIQDLHHLPRGNWIDWMKELSTFKIGIHMMPIYAAGTFMANCAWYGIPCIAPKQFDTQFDCYPEITILSAEDIIGAEFICEELNNNIDFYNKVSKTAYELIRESCHINIDKWKKIIYPIVNYERISNND